MRSLITGVSGFVGYYCTELLCSTDREVFGIDRWEECRLDTIRYYQIDITDAGALTKLLQEIEPDEVYHLAAISYLPDADASPRVALDINIMGTVALLDAVNTVCPQARVLLVGSSKEYDNTKTFEAIDEHVEPNPTNFYGISKYAMELIGIQYVRQYGLDIRISRSFNHTGPGQSPRFVCSDWARQVAEIVAKKADPVIKVGDLNAEIDFSDVRDVVEAYRALVEKGKKGETYNVCSGTAVSLRFILDHLIAKSPVPIEVETAHRKIRGHATSPRLIGNNSKLVSHTGWKPSIPLTRTLDDLFEYWIKQVAV
jgi:GDP-4-dehydro-6-deoxy-D-mannose reductase